MKKKVFILIVSILVVAFFVSGNMWVERVNMELVKDADVCFRYGNADVMHTMGEDEVELLKRIFDGKKMYSDDPSCGFSEDISVRFNNEQTFCIAQDTCPIVYLKEKNKYIKLSENEKKQLYDLLEPYGFFFPYV